VHKEIQKDQLSNQDPSTSESFNRVKPIVATEPPEESATITEDGPKDSIPNTLHWSKIANINSSSIFGNVLFSCPSPHNVKTISALERSASTSPTLFTTNIPNISRILAARTAYLTHARPVQTVRMRFLPNPFANTAKSNPAVQIGHKALATFPLIEMQFAVQKRDGILVLQTIESVLSTENSDLLLPESSVDIRFQQTITRRLHMPEHNNTRTLPRGIAAFLSTSNLSVKDGKGRLATPAKLEIPLQAHLCHKPDFKALGMEDPGQDTFEVPYLFAGLEILNTMVMETENGWALTYKSIEAGRAGGRRAELELLPSRKKALEGNSEKAFVREAFKIAAGLDKGANSARANASDGEHKIRWWNVKGAKREFYSRKVIVSENLATKEQKLEATTDQEAGTSNEKLPERKEEAEDLPEHEAKFIAQHLEEQQLIDNLEEEEESHPAQGGA